MTSITAGTPEQAVGGLEILAFLFFGVIYVGVCVLMFYVLYRVLRAAIRDGLRDATPSIKEAILARRWPEGGGGT